MRGDCILGNASLHEQLYLATQVLQKLISSSPRSATLLQLEEHTGSAGTVRALCRRLSRAGLLEQAPGMRDSWRLACSPAALTLENVFLSISTMNSSRRNVRENVSARANSDVEGFIMQATFAVNQGLLKQLRQFSLDRLKFCRAAFQPSLTRRAPISYSAKDSFSG